MTTGRRVEGEAGRGAGQGVEQEAGRQRALLAALWSRDAGDADALASLLNETDARAAQGLGAYRANAGALAERALGATFPTVQAMVGGDNFAHLAREFRRFDPPRRGDIAAWGDAFPAWLQAHPAFAAWPWLGDSARLDLMLHGCERAPDAAFDGASFARLESDDPETLRLVVPPGTALLSSAYPIAALHAAHAIERSGEAGDGDAFAAARAAIADGRGQHALVARHGWKAQVHEIDAATADWMRTLLDGVTLGRALALAGDGFDFAAWLGAALRHGWLQAVRPAEAAAR